MVGDWYCSTTNAAVMGSTDEACIVISTPEDSATAEDWIYTDVRIPCEYPEVEEDLPVKSKRNSPRKRISCKNRKEDILNPPGGWFFFKG